MSQGEREAGDEMDEMDDLDRISGFLIAVFQSPTWGAPIAKFIDENCGSFEDTEENKLEYTLIHNAFKQLIDDLLTAHLTGLEVTPEQFTLFCQHGLTGNNELHRNLVEQLLGVEDFLLFKAMMVKRNAELYCELLEPMGFVVATWGLGPDADCDCDDAGEEDEQLGSWSEEAARLERLEAEQRCVEAELQLAIALSRHLEKRLQLIEALNEVMELAAQISKHCEEPATESVPEKVTKAPRELAPVIPPTVRLKPLDQPPKVEPGAGSAASPIVSADQEKVEAQAVLHHVVSTLAVPVAPNLEAAQTTAGARQQPAGAALPSEEERRARAEHLRRQRERLLEKKNKERETQLTALKQTDGPTPAMRAAERALSHSTFASASPQSPSEAGRRLAAELSGQAGNGAPATLEDPEAAAVEMRRAIARQLKQALVQSLP